MEVGGGTSQDAVLLVAGGADHMVYCWDLRYMEQGPILEFEGHDGTVYSMVLDRAHGTLLSGAGDHNIICWDVSSGVSHEVCVLGLFFLFLVSRTFIDRECT